MSDDCYPAPFTKVFFLSATAIVRGWSKGPSSKPVGGVTSSHRANPAIKLQKGHIFIDQRWGRLPQEKPKTLDEDAVKRLKNRFKKK